MTVNESTETVIAEMQYQLDLLHQENNLLKSNDNVLQGCIERLTGVVDKLAGDNASLTVSLRDTIIEQEQLKKDNESYRIKLDIMITAINEQNKTQQKSLDNIIDSFGEILTKLHTLVEETENAKGTISGLETLYHCMGDQVDDLEKSVKKIKKKVKQNKLTLTVS